MRERAQTRANLLLVFFYAILPKNAEVENKNLFVKDGDTENHSNAHCNQSTSPIDLVSSGKSFV